MQMVGRRASLWNSLPKRHTLEHSESLLRKQGKLSTTRIVFLMWLGFNLHLEELFHVNCHSAVFAGYPRLLSC